MNNKRRITTFFYKVGKNVFDECYDSFLKKIQKKKINKDNFIKVMILVLFLFFSISFFFFSTEENHLSIICLYILKINKWLNKNFHLKIHLHVTKLSVAHNSMKPDNRKKNKRRIGEREKENEKTRCIEEENKMKRNKRQ